MNRKLTQLFVSKQKKENTVVDDYDDIYDEDDKEGYEDSVSTSLTVEVEKQSTRQIHRSNSCKEKKVKLETAIFYDVSHLYDGINSHEDTAVDEINDDDNTKHEGIDTLTAEANIYEADDRDVTYAKNTLVQSPIKKSGKIKQSPIAYINKKIHLLESKGKVMTSRLGTLIGNIKPIVVHNDNENEEIYDEEGNVKEDAVDQIPVEEEELYDHDEELEWDDKRNKDTKNKLKTELFHIQKGEEERFTNTEGKSGTKKSNVEVNKKTYTAKSKSVLKNFASKLKKSENPKRMKDKNIEADQIYEEDVHGCPTLDFKAEVDDGNLEEIYDADENFEDLKLDDVEEIYDDDKNVEENPTKIKPAKTSLTDKIKQLKNTKINLPKNLKFQFPNVKRKESDKEIQIGNFKVPIMKDDSDEIYEDEGSDSSPIKSRGNKDDIEEVYDEEEHTEEIGKQDNVSSIQTGNTRKELMEPNKEIYDGDDQGNIVSEFNNGNPQDEASLLKCKFSDKNAVITVSSKEQIRKTGDSDLKKKPKFNSKTTVKYLTKQLHSLEEKGKLLATNIENSANRIKQKIDYKEKGGLKIMGKELHNGKRGDDDNEVSNEKFNDPISFDVDDIYDDDGKNESEFENQNKTEIQSPKLIKNKIFNIPGKFGKKLKTSIQIEEEVKDNVFVTKDEVESQKRMEHCKEEIVDENLDEHQDVAQPTGERKGSIKNKIGSSIHCMNKRMKELELKGRLLKTNLENIASKIKHDHIEKGKETDEIYDDDENLEKEIVDCGVREIDEIYDDDCGNEDKNIKEESEAGVSQNTPARENNECECKNKVDAELLNENTEKEDKKKLNISMKSSMKFLNKKMKLLDSKGKLLTADIESRANKLKKRIENQGTSGSDKAYKRKDMSNDVAEVEEIYDDDELDQNIIIRKDETKEEANSQGEYPNSDCMACSEDVYDADDISENVSSTSKMEEHTKHKSSFKSFSNKMKRLEVSKNQFKENFKRRISDTKNIQPNMSVINQEEETYEEDNKDDMSKVYVISKKSSEKKLRAVLEKLGQNLGTDFKAGVTCKNEVESDEAFDEVKSDDSEQTAKQFRDQILALSSKLNEMKKSFKLKKTKKPAYVMSIVKMSKPNTDDVDDLYDSDEHTNLGKKDENEDDRNMFGKIELDSKKKHKINVKSSMKYFNKRITALETKRKSVAANIEESANRIKLRIMDKGKKNLETQDTYDYDSVDYVNSPELLETSAENIGTTSKVRIEPSEETYDDDTIDDLTSVSSISSVSDDPGKDIIEKDNNVESSSISTRSTISKLTGKANDDGLSEKILDYKKQLKSQVSAISNKLGKTMQKLKDKKLKLKMIKSNMENDIYDSDDRNDEVSTNASFKDFTEVDEVMVKRKSHLKIKLSLKYINKQIQSLEKKRKKQTSGIETIADKVRQGIVDHRKNSIKLRTEDKVAERVSDVDDIYDDDNAHLESDEIDVEVESGCTTHDALNSLLTEDIYDADEILDNISEIIKTEDTIKSKTSQLYFTNKIKQLEITKGKFASNLKKLLSDRKNQSALEPDSNHDDETYVEDLEDSTSQSTMSVTSKVSKPCETISTNSSVKCKKKIGFVLSKLGKNLGKNLKETEKTDVVCGNDEQSDESFDEVMSDDSENTAKYIREQIFALSSKLKMMKKSFKRKETKNITNDKITPPKKYEEDDDIYDSDEHVKETINDDDDGGGDDEVVEQIANSSKKKFQLSVKTSISYLNKKMEALESRSRLITSNLEKSANKLKNKIVDKRKCKAGLQDIHDEDDKESGSSKEDCAIEGMTAEIYDDDSKEDIISLSTVSTQSAVSNKNIVSRLKTTRKSFSTKLNKNAKLLFAKVKNTKPKNDQKVANSIERKTSESDDIYDSDEHGSVAEEQDKLHEEEDNFNTNLTKSDDCGKVNIKPQHRSERIDDKAINLKEENKSGVERVEEKDGCFKKNSFNFASSMKCLKKHLHAKSNAAVSTTMDDNEIYDDDHARDDNVDERVDGKRICVKNDSIDEIYDEDENERLEEATVGDDAKLNLKKSKGSLIKENIRSTYRKFRKENVMANDDVYDDDEDDGDSEDGGNDKSPADCIEQDPEVAQGASGVNIRSENTGTTVVTSTIRDKEPGQSKSLSIRDRIKCYETRTTN